MPPEGALRVIVDEGLITDETTGTPESFHAKENLPAIASPPVAVRTTLVMSFLVRENLIPVQRWSNTIGTVTVAPEPGSETVALDARMIRSSAKVPATPVWLEGSVVVILPPASEAFES